MLPDLNNIETQVRQVVEKGFIIPMQQKWESHRHIIDTYIEFVKKYENRMVEVNDKSASEEYLQDVNNLLSHYVMPPSTFCFDEEFGDYLKEANSYISLYQTVVRDKQPDSALKYSKDDGTLLKAGKNIKKFWFYTTRSPRIIRNMFLKIAGKTRRPLSPLMRKVPVRGIMHNFVASDLPGELHNRLFLPFHLRIEKELKVLLEIEGLLQKSDKKDGNAKKILREIGSLTGNLRKERNFPFQTLVNEVFHDVLPLLGQHFDKAGTLDLPRREFSDRKNKQRHSQIISKYRKTGTHSNIKLISMLDAWQMITSVNLLLEKVRALTADTASFISAQLKETNGDVIDKAYNDLQRFTRKLTKAEDEAALAEILPQLENEVAQNLVRKRIPKAIEVIENEDAILKIQEFTGLAMEYVAQMAESVNILNSSEGETKLLTAGDITRVKIRHLVEHDSLPLILEPAAKAKAAILGYTKQSREQLLETGRIAEYNLETAISLLGTGADFEQLLQIANEGLGRSISRIGETREATLKLEEKISGDFDNALNTFAVQLAGYLDTKSLLDARSRIVKAKALKKSEQIWTNIKYLSFRFWIYLLSGLKFIYKYSKGKYKIIRSHLGLDPIPPLVSAEISDFLAETQRAIARLPYVYQRLFVLSPLNDEKFFRGRKAELDQLADAYQNWLFGRYAPTVIVGETGSGTTSLLNLFCSNNLSETVIYRIEDINPIGKSDEFYSLMQGPFQGASFKSKDEIINHLNSLPHKAVFILEGVHHLFLRTIHGFDVIRQFAEIISATNGNIFWLTTSTLYGWRYLDKVMQLSDFFGYIVELRALSDGEIVDVILRRHMASGYNLNFELPENEKAGRRIAQIKDPAEKNEYLKQRYFNSLNQFARSNIAISMLIWLRSARDVNGNQITIALPSGLNLSFIKSLSREKLFLLQALLVHDGLPEHEIAGVMNFTRARIRLLVVQLFDDGVIVLKRGLYVINPLLYRQVVSTLKDANLIH